MVKRRTHLEKLAVPVYGVEDLPISEIRRHTGQDRVAKLSFNENPYGAPPAIKAALEAACMEIARYGDPHYREIYEALATYTGKEVENIIVGICVLIIVYKIYYSFINTPEHTST